VQRVQTAAEGGQTPGLACPECSAVCVAPVATGGYRCGQCGWQWNNANRPNLADIPGNTRSTISK
jgi:ribosomal protein L37AE/L43A